MDQSKIKYIEKVDISTLTLCCSYNYHKVSESTCQVILVYSTKFIRI